jgi:hypothetical protein
VVRGSRTRAGRESKEHGQRGSEKSLPGQSPARTYLWQTTYLKLEGGGGEMGSGGSKEGVRVGGVRRVGKVGTEGLKKRGRGRRRGWTRGGVCVGREGVGRDGRR